MFRQVYSAQTIPFKQHIIKENAIVFAVDYDLGRDHFAYLDHDDADYHVSTGKRRPWNTGGQYRNDGVDIETCTDSLTNGFSVGWIEDGEWIQYTIDVAAAGCFDLKIRTASDSAGTFRLSINDVDVSGNILLAGGAGDKGWETTTIKNISLTTGINRFKLFVVKGGFQLNYFNFTRS
jgi:hypothetical protein